MFNEILYIRCFFEAQECLRYRITSQAQLILRGFKVLNYGDLHCKLNLPFKSLELLVITICARELKNFVLFSRFLSENQEHPLVKGLSQEDFIFSGRKFELMLNQAYGEGAHRDKWTFTNKGGKVEAVRAGKVVPSKLLYPPLESPQKGFKSPERKGKQPLSDEKGGKKLKLGEQAKAYKVLPKIAVVSKQAASIMKHFDGSSALGKERNMPSKASYENVEDNCPSSLSAFMLEDVEGNLRPIDMLNLVQEDVEGKLKRLNLLGKAEDGADVKVLVYRWKVTAEPWGIAVKTKKAHQW
jgi:hypothetical protein